jgi:hypothetical protein
MLRAAYLSRSQPVTFNFLLVNKRWQQTPASPGSGTTASTKSTPGSNATQYATSNPSSTTRTQTASTSPSFNAPIDRTNNPYKTTTAPTSSSVPPSSSKNSPPPPFSTPSTPRSSGGGSGTMVKAIIYGVTLGLTATLVYAEYENGSFRHQLESTVPFSSTILGGLDQVIDPVFGRQKKLTTIISEKIPDLSYVKDKLPDKDSIKKIGQEAKDTVTNAYDKLTDQKKVKGAVDQASNQVPFLELR